MSLSVFCLFVCCMGVLIHLNEMTLVWYRIMITVVSLSVMFALTKKSTRIPKQQAVRFFLIGTLIALHWVAFYGSIKLSNVSIGLVCFSATGLFTALLEPLLVTKKLQWVELGLGLLS